MSDQAPVPGQGSFAAVLAVPAIPAGDGQVADGATATPPTAPVAAPAAAPVAPAIPWLPEADELTTGYIQNKGWQNPAQVLDSYRNLEKLLGADKAGNAVIVPKPDAPKAELDAFFNRLGRPTDPDGYKIDKVQGSDPAFSKVVSGWFHELGLNQQQGEKLAAKFNEHVAGIQAARIQQTQADFETDNAKLTSEWGAAFQQKLADAQAACRGLGLDDATVDKLQGALGHYGLLNLLSKIGGNGAEPGFETGRSTGFQAALTPAQAKAEIASLSADKDFRAKIMAKDVTATQRWAQLHEWAFPEVKG